MKKYWLLDPDTGEVIDGVYTAQMDDGSYRTIDSSATAKEMGSYFFFALESFLSDERYKELSYKDLALFIYLTCCIEKEPIMKTYDFISSFITELPQYNIGTLAKVGLITKKDSGYLVNREYITEGSSPYNMRGEKLFAIRKFVYRCLYVQCSTEQRNLIGKIIKLAPHLNYFTNEICSNPGITECITQIPCIPFTGISALLGESIDSTRRLISAFKEMKFDCKGRTFRVALCEKDSEKSPGKMSILPYLFYRGANVDKTYNLKKDKDRKSSWEI